MTDTMEYKHGGNPQSDLDRFGLSERPELDFSVNLNFLGPPEIVHQNWPELFNCIIDYPNLEGNGVKSYYQDKFDISPDSLLAGNGSTELIYLVPRALGFKKVAIITPSYHDYERASVVAGAEVLQIPLPIDTAFTFPEISDIAEKIKSVDALWLGRPNNPTGTMVSKEFIIELADHFPEKLFIVDEAFIQFVEDWGKKSLLTGKYPSNILVLHSLTKFYALAGLRLGGIKGSVESISRLKKFKEPWSINGVADRVARLLIDCEEYDRQTTSQTTQERDRIYRRLMGIQGIRTFSPSANFILCQWVRTPDLDELIKQLLSKGIYIRDCRNFAGLEDNFFRIGLRSMEDNDKLIHLLEHIVNHA